MQLRRAWGEYHRLRRERARLKTLLVHQLYGVFPELVGEWKTVGGAWLFQPGELGKAVWRGLTDVSFGAAMKPHKTTVEIPPVLRQWMEEIAGYDFTKEASGGTFPAWTISYDDAARHIARLESGLARVVSEIRSL